MSTYVNAETLRGSWAFFESESEEKTQEAKCPFCHMHGRGESIAIQDWSWELEWYHNIRYCPLCGKRLRTMVVLDGVAL